MKVFKIFCISMWAALVGVSAFAQVNLDQPLNAGQSDMVFRSAVDPKIAYYFPIGLNRVSAVITSQTRDRINVQFNIGISAEDLNVVRAQLDKNGFKDLEIHFLKPLAYFISASTSIDPEFQPVVTPLGDLNVGVPMPINLSIVRKRSFFGGSPSTDLLNELFRGPKQAGHIGSINYKVNAIVGGKPYVGKTVVGIFVGSDSKVPASRLRESGAVSQRFAAFEAVAALKEGPGPIRFDSEVHCWDNVQPGTFCLREK